MNLNVQLEEASIYLINFINDVMKLIIRSNGSKSSYLNMILIMIYKFLRIYMYIDNNSKNSVAKDKIFAVNYFVNAIRLIIHV